MGKITVVGGGTGLSVLLRGIKRLDNAEITAVVSVADDGGSSGGLREDLGMLPPGDIRSCLLALASEEEDMQEILSYRFRDGRLAGQSMGNLIIAAATEIYGNFEEAIERISAILKVKGRVVPVSSEKMNLCAELENGNIVVGESSIPKVAQRENSHIAYVFLDDDELRVSRSARIAVSEADIIVIGPGSLYTSIIPNLLVAGLRKELEVSKAKKIYVGNVMTQPGETDGMGLADHVRTILRYMDGGELDLVIANNKMLDPAITERYLMDGAEQILVTEADRAYLSEQSISLTEGDFIEVKKGYIRHDAAAVAALIHLSF